jgi:hypothetical protein
MAPETDDPEAAFLADTRMQAEDHHLVPASMVLPLLEALESVLTLADDWTEGSYSSSSALDEDRAWVRAACGAKVREAITAALKEGTGA